MVSRIKDDEKAKRILEKVALESEHGLVFNAYIGGELDSVVTCLNENRPTDLQMIELIKSLCLTLSDLADGHPELYCVALRELPQTELLDI
ncbi:MAG: hypothetical protein IKL68_03000 [Clostridia bacterium]|nr:hypothetical protein [Clostridia bacterium]